MSSSQGNPAHHRTVRSFVRREGRLTPGQIKSLEQNWSVYGIDNPDGPIDFIKLFGRVSQVNLELGFGSGEALLAMAAARPDEDFIGVEVYRPGAGRLMAAAADQGLTNIRIMLGDAVELFKVAIPDFSLSNVYIFFPDPWHKKRHHKRRLIQAGFIELLASKIKPEGTMNIATDWENYAEHILEVMAPLGHLFRNSSETKDFIARPDYRPLTKFEKRGINRGHGVWDFSYIRRS